ncbi:flagellar filament capping protein FliD, partial [Thermodesulfobacteriota bacterium]
RRPITLLQRQEASYQAKISGVGAMKSVLSELQTAASALKETDLFDSFSVKSGNTDILSASASDTAVAGTYSVEVTQLAEAHSIKSFAFADSDTTVVGTGTLSIQLGTNTAVEVVIDSDHNTLAGIATAINDSDAEVTAGVLNDGAGNYYLTLSGKDTGAANTITFEVTADDTGTLIDDTGLSRLYETPATKTMTEDNVALDAQLTVNNNPVSRASNTIDDLIQGVTLDLKKAEVGTQFDVTVSRDVASVTAKISGFVTAYNNALTGLQSLQASNPDTGEIGLLQGDSTPRLAQSQLQSLLRTTVDGVVSDFDTLSELGVTADEDGQLTFDSAVFTTAYESNRTDIVNFFTQTTAGSEGFALQFENFLDGYVDSSTGLLSSKEDSLNSSIDRIGDQVEKIEFRLAKREANLRRQFESLESLLAQFQTTSGVLTQQLSSLSNLNTQISKL